MRIGCTEVRPSSKEEKNAFSLEMKPSLPDTISLTSIHNYKEVGKTNVIKTPCIELEPVNPHNSSFKTVVIQNFRYTKQHNKLCVDRLLPFCLLNLFSNVNLPFAWKYYQPLTRSLDIKDDSGLTCSTSSTPCQSDSSPFFISPNSGTIPARQMATFVIRFNPKEVKCLICIFVVLLLCMMHPSAWMFCGYGLPHSNKTHQR